MKAINPPITTRPRIAFITTSVLQVQFFLRPHLCALHEHFDVTLVVSNDHPDILQGLNLPVRVVVLDLPRTISPARDALALWRLGLFLKRERFDMVHTVNPKAGLLGMMAAFALRVPVRAHIFQGEVWACKTGLWRWFLKQCDGLVARLATHLTVVSHSEQAFLLQEGVLPAGKSQVLGAGSISGVDTQRFAPQPALRAALRAQHGFCEHDVVLMYLGRLHPDKGLHELAQAFAQLYPQRPQLRLVVVGPDEGGFVPLFTEMGAKLATRLDTELDIEQAAGLATTQAGHSQRAVQVLPYTAQPEAVLQMADVLVLPSHREGFGMVVVEAAALGVPAVASRIYGISDAVDDGHTGLLFPVRDVQALADALLVLCDQPQHRHQLGMAAQARVKAKFEQTDVVQRFVDYHHRCLR